MPTRWRGTNVSGAPSRRIGKAKERDEMPCDRTPDRDSRPSPQPRHAGGESGVKAAQQVRYRARRKLGGPRSSAAAAAGDVSDGPRVTWCVRLRWSATLPATTL